MVGARVRVRVAEHLPVLAGVAAARRRVGGDPSWEEPLLVRVRARDREEPLLVRVRARDREEPLSV